MASKKKRRTGKGSRTRPVVILEPVLVPIMAKEEQQAIEALAELLTPLFLHELTREREGDE